MYIYNIQIHEGTSIYMYIVYIDIVTDMHLYNTHICIYTYLYISVYKHVYVCVCVYVYIYTKKRCDVCENVNITDSFTSSVTQKIYKINYKLNCDDKWLIYLLPCKRHLKQYVRETTDAFRKRWSNYKNNTRKFVRGESCMQQYLFEHFQSPGHTGFVKDVYNFYRQDSLSFLPNVKINGGKH